MWGFHALSVEREFLLVVEIVIIVILINICVLFFFLFGVCIYCAKSHKVYDKVASEADLMVTSCYQRQHEFNPKIKNWVVIKNKQVQVYDGLLKLKCWKTNVFAIGRWVLKFGLWVVNSPSSMVFKLALSIEEIKFTNRFVPLNMAD